MQERKKKARPCSSANEKRNFAESPEFICGTEKRNQNSPPPPRGRDGSRCSNREHPHPPAALVEGGGFFVFIRSRWCLVRLHQRLLELNADTAEPGCPVTGSPSVGADGVLPRLRSRALMSANSLLPGAHRRRTLSPGAWGGGPHAPERLSGTWAEGGWHPMHIGVRVCVWGGEFQLNRLTEKNTQFLETLQNGGGLRECGRKGAVSGSGRRDGLCGIFPLTESPERSRGPGFWVSGGCQDPGTQSGLDRHPFRANQSFYLFPC